MDYLEEQLESVQVMYTPNNIPELRAEIEYAVGYVEKSRNRAIFWGFRFLVNKHFKGEVRYHCLSARLAELEGNSREQDYQLEHARSHQHELDI